MRLCKEDRYLRVKFMAKVVDNSVIFIFIGLFSNDGGT